MRGCYLRKGFENNRGGSRGGVGDKWGEGDYALEIGNNQRADCEMMALASMVDEVKELLENSKSSLAKLVLYKWQDITKALEEQSRE